MLFRSVAGRCVQSRASQNKVCSLDFVFLWGGFGRGYLGVAVLNVVRLYFVGCVLDLVA